MKINSTTAWLLSPWWLQWLVPMGSIWFWEPHLGDRFLTVCSVWQVCSAEGVNLRTDLKYLYSSRAMYLLQSCITFCTVYNKGSCFLFLPDCLGSCFACALGCCLGLWGLEWPRLQPIIWGLESGVAGAGSSGAALSPVLDLLLLGMDPAMAFTKLHPMRGSIWKGGAFCPVAAI